MQAFYAPARPSLQQQLPFYVPGLYCIRMKNYGLRREKGRSQRWQHINAWGSSLSMLSLEGILDGLLNP